MLRAKRKSDGQIVTAYEESKINAPFFCLECQDIVNLVTSASKVNYFAHQNPLTCRNEASESDDHRRCKKEIFEALRREPNVHDAALERPLGSNRPDVSAIINNVPVAIEIQISSLSEETIKHRTMEYARKGIYVLWLLLWTPELADTRYTPKHWEKWIHTTYFGHVYYWIEGLKVVSYKFEPSIKSVPKTLWYSKDGNKMTGGGYTRRSKRYRTPMPDAMWRQCLSQKWLGILPVGKQFRIDLMVTEARQLARPARFPKGLFQDFRVMVSHTKGHD